MQLSCTYTSTSTLVITLGTLTGITLLTSIQGVARTYDNPASTTVFPAQYNITASTGVVGINAGATSRGCIGTIVFPLPVTTATRGNVEQLRGSNSGDLVGIGDRAEVGEIEPREETKTDEPIEDNTEVKESGESDQLR